LFITPVEPEVGIKAVEKSAGGPRSAIRRHRALRGFNSPAHQREAARRRRILSTGAEASLEEEYEIWDMRRASSGQNGTRDVTITNRRGGQYSQRVVADQERLRATVLSERRNRSYEPDGSSMMPPVPETRDYYTVRGESDRLRQPSDLQRLARNSAPTPPYTETDLAFLARRPSASPRPSSLNESARPVRRLLGRVSFSRLILILLIVHQCSLANLCKSDLLDSRCENKYSRRTERSSLMDWEIAIGV
jgi:hypothetical protein